MIDLFYTLRRVVGYVLLIKGRATKQINYFVAGGKGRADLLKSDWNMSRMMVFEKPPLALDKGKNGSNRPSNVVIS